MVDYSQRAPLPRQFRRVHVADPQEITGPTHTPGTCRECSANTVPCWLCADEEGVPKHHPLTDELREVTHIGICPEHGVIHAACPVTTHMVKPVLEPQVRIVPDRNLYVRTAVIGLLAGTLIGLAIGLSFNFSAYLQKPNTQEIER